jgi:hypothetical protein
VPTEEVVAEIQKTFTPFFIIPERSRAERCERRWRDLLGDHVICLETAKDICFVAAGTILLGEGLAKDMKKLEDLLAGAGLPSDRKNSVIRSLTPFAEAVFTSG